MLTHWEGPQWHLIGKELHTDQHIDEEEETHEHGNVGHVPQGTGDHLKHLLEVFPELG